MQGLLTVCLLYGAFALIFIIASAIILVLRAKLSVEEVCQRQNTKNCAIACWFVAAVFIVIALFGYMSFRSEYRPETSETGAVTEQAEDDAFLKQLDKEQKEWEAEMAQQQAEWEAMRRRREAEWLAEEKLQEQEMMKASSILAEIETQRIRRKFDSRIMRLLQELKERKLHNEKQLPMMGPCRTNTVC